MGGHTDKSSLWPNALSGTILHKQIKLFVHAEKARSMNKRYRRFFEIKDWRHHSINDSVTIQVPSWYNTFVLNVG